MYYIGQDEYEFYDLTNDPDEQNNLWYDNETIEEQQYHLRKLLDFLGASNYFTSGYKRTRQPDYKVRWHSTGDTTLHGDSAFTSQKYD